MFGRSIQFPNVGRLKRGWGKWYGELVVPQLESPLRLSIEIDRKELVEPFAQQAALFAATFGKLREDFREELFESYCLFKKTDLEEGVFTEAEYAEYPAVTSASNVWNALKPFRLCLGRPMDRHYGNSYLLVDVSWPNPHYFQVFMNATPAGFEHMHTSLEG